MLQTAHAQTGVSQEPADPGQLVAVLFSSRTGKAMMCRIRCRALGLTFPKARAKLQPTFCIISAHLLPQQQPECWEVETSSSHPGNKPCNIQMCIHRATAYKEIKLLPTTISKQGMCGPSHNYSFKEWVINSINEKQTQTHTFHPLFITDVWISPPHNFKSLDREVFKQMPLNIDVCSISFFCLFI